MANATVQQQRANTLAQSRQQARVQADRMKEQSTTNAPLPSMPSPGIPDQPAGGPTVQAGTAALPFSSARLGQREAAMNRLGQMNRGGADDDFEAEEEEATQMAEARASQLRSSVAISTILTTLTGQQVQSNAKEEATQKLRAEVQKKAKAAFKRGIVIVVDFIAACLDLGSWVTSLVDWILYLFTFAWLNLQLFYGSYFSKGKSKFISPLDWDPLPINGIVPPLILHMALIAADLLLIILGGFMAGIVMVFFAILWDLFSNPAAAAYDILTGSGDLGEFSGMIRDVLGL